MQYYLKPENGPQCFFSVLDHSGHFVYQVTGAYTALGCRLVLRTAAGVNAAHMQGVCLSDTYRFLVSSGARRIRIHIRPQAPPRRAVQFKGVGWYFRGSLSMRSFDILSGNPHGMQQTVMTHARCWNSHGDCYAVTVSRAEDVPLALCVAAAADLAMIGGCAAPVPVG